MLSPDQIRIDLKLPEPAYRQIAGQIRGLLVARTLKAGAAMPSVRRLATSLGVHFNTVAEAYRTLGGEGWLEVSQGRAVRVADRETPKPPGDEAGRIFRRRLDSLVSEMRASGLSAGWIRGELKEIRQELKPFS